MTQTNKSKGGGIKGFFNRAASSFQQGFQISREWSYWLAQKGGTVGLFLASTSMVVLMPLVFEINREITSVASERLQVTELRNQGHSDRQLQEMGFLEVAIHSPSVAAMNKA
uniref:Uncharacterized protein n=1 Tax=Pseudo-nitzschia australis TaxID=44445 RepID=A0A7S4A9Y4_9STRA|mmetsp:Transcript_94/g.254  ORF Transcript_94/g.254 Transcript_94/m.254 type:complete len:112 (+) Transcript_94:174-509(+)|eukprot:CAMPEP_0168187274 /NCGR_PEP_ID=MMETSP0139_2-20121125/14937_1 /TAXON_ID=44445 /ORGANISM="Pseudo-nitzschia australis, Strain 10249 10 AB" /LENGTH=111 /DNA_ID=CAMNT_0008109455 /DNA_START=115 /DNA_END=450 /DNA_ORIENTATION=-